MAGRDNIQQGITDLQSRMDRQDALLETILRHIAAPTLPLSPPPPPSQLAPSPQGADPLAAFSDRGSSPSPSKVVKRNGSRCRRREMVPLPKQHPCADTPVTVRESTAQVCELHSGDYCKLYSGDYLYAAAADGTQSISYKRSTDTEAHCRSCPDNSKVVAVVSAVVVFVVCVEWCSWSV